MIGNHTGIGTRITLGPFGEFVSTNDQGIQFVLSLLEVLKGLIAVIFQILIHNVKEDIIGIRVLEPFTDQQGIEKDLPSVPRRLLPASLDL